MLSSESEEWIAGFQCNELIGQKAGDRFEKRDRERIVILLLNRTSDKQQVCHTYCRSYASFAF